MKVQSKLFVITLVACLTLVAVMTMLAQWRLDVSLLKHVNQRAQAEYETLLEPLTAFYRQTGSWHGLKQHPRLWRQMKQEAGIQEQLDSNGRPPPPPPPPRNGLNERLGFGPLSNGERPRDARPRRPVGLPLAVLDKDKQFVVGFEPRPEHRQYIPIELRGNVIGYILYAKRDRLMDGFDLDFSQELSQYLWLIAIIMVALSAVLALPFAQFLLKPIRPIVNTIGQLAQGNFSDRVNAKGKDEISQVAQNVNQLAQYLEENEQQRKQWLANISHELRTPIAVMRGELEAMLDGVRKLDHEQVASSHQEVMHLQRLVEDLYQLTSSDIGALSYQFQHLDFSELVEEQVSRFQSMMKKAQLSLRFQVSPRADDLWVEGDEQRITQVIYNILQNAMKYTNKPGEVKVSLSQKDQNALLVIEDSAPSVKTDELEKIFDHLYRADASRNRKTGGSGLGLAICKKIVEGHQGRIWASESSLGGVKISIELPLV